MCVSLSTQNEIATGSGREVNSAACKHVGYLDESKQSQSVMSIKQKRDTYSGRLDHSVGRMKFSFLSGKYINTFILNPLAMADIS